MCRLLFSFSQLSRTEKSKSKNERNTIILPGWTIVRDHSLDTKVVRNIYTSAPLFLMGWSVRPELIYTPVKIGRIAPTLAHFMRIRAPNAATLPPMTDIRK